MAGLVWIEAAAHHRQTLSKFVCTDPPKRLYERHRGPHHPRPWEIEVQSHLRGLKVPVGDGEALLLGSDTSGVAAAVHFGFDDSYTQFMIWAVACAHRCKGRRYGRDAIQMALNSMRSTKAHYNLDCGVLTYVDPRNEASRKLVTALGFEFLQVDDGYEAWVRDI